MLMARAAKPVRHVLMTADAMGGVWTYALALASELARAGVRTTVATMGAAPSAEQRAAASAIPGTTLVESTYRLEWMDRPWEDVAAAGGWLLGLERALRPDVVHLNGYAHARLPWNAPCVVAAHSCVFSWWRSVHGHAPPPVYDRYREEVTGGLAAAAAVVAPTRWMLDAVGREYHAVARGAVVANGLEDVEGGAARKEPLVFGAGRLWDGAKNLEALIRAAERVTWPVVLAGQDRSPDGRAVDTDGVCFLGWLEARAIRRWMGRAAIFASPARYEPFGLAALEAALRGCALVLGDIPSLREVWGSAATYAPPDDPEALGAAIERLIQDHALRAQAARAARARARRLSAKAMGSRYLALYGEVASRARREPTSAEDACA
jgi:glycosyltransferase involved in cell wall biosynthesis